MTLLVSGILALFLGPVFYSRIRRRDDVMSLVDGLIFVTITGLVLLFILPESLEAGGWPVLLYALLGLLLPSFVERFSRRLARTAHVAALVLGLTGLGLHALLDGAALSGVDAGLSAMLMVAVILHRFLEGLTIWWLLRPNFGHRWAVGVLGGVTLATVFGFVLGPVMTGALTNQSLAWFQALVGGTLLHVVFHQPHLNRTSCECGETARSSRWYEGAGALLGVGLVVLLMGESAEHGDAHLVQDTFRTFWALALESAPALLLAYAMAGMLHAFLPPSSISWLRKGGSLTQAVRGMAVGLPFPVCSCGIVPLYQALIRKGAPATAGMAFLIATPELGLDAVLLSIPLLGVDLTLLRVGAAALVAALVGWVVGSFAVHQRPHLPGAPVETIHRERRVGQRLLAAVKVGFGEVVDNTAPWILLGLFVAAVAHPFLSAGWLADVPRWLEVPLFTLLGLPAYVCASGATPLVAVLLAGGVSPGAGLAFLITGPATNATTFGMLTKLHGKQVAFLFSVTIIVLAVVAGYAVNLGFPESGQAGVDFSGQAEGSSLQLVCLALLLGAIGFSILRRGARRFVAELLYRNQSTLDLHPHYH